MLIKTCVICGKDFQAIRQNGLTCSIECRKEYAKQYAKAIYAENKEEIIARNRIRRQERRARKAVEKVKAKQPKLTIDDMARVAKELRTTYGKLELARSQGKVKIERKKSK